MTSSMTGLREGADLFRSRLGRMVNMRHELVRLAERVATQKRRDPPRVVAQKRHRPRHRSYEE